MSFADASRGRFTFRQQAAFGEDLPANPATTRVRLKSESLHHKNATVVSEEIRSDRQRSDLILVGRDIDGEIAAELSYGNFDWAFEAALCGTWANKTATLSATTVSASPTVTAAGITGDDLHKAVTGAGIPASSYIGVVTPGVSFGLSSSATVNTPVNATASATITATIVGRGADLNNGTTNRSFDFERGFLDLGKYIFFRHCIINTLNLDITARQIAQISMGIMGSRAYSSATQMGGSTTPTEPNSNPVISAGPLIQLFNSGGTNTELNGISTKEVKLSINNQGRIRDIATDIDLGDFGRGSMDITGSLHAYFESTAIFDAFVANAFCSLRFTMSDPVDLGKSYRVTLPSVKLLDANPNLGGVESDVMQQIPFRALLDAGVGYTAHIERGIWIPAAP